MSDTPNAPVTNRGAQSAVIHNEKQDKNPDEIRLKSNLDELSDNRGDETIKTYPKKWSGKHYDLIIDWFECTFIKNHHIDNLSGQVIEDDPLTIQQLFKDFGLDPYSDSFTNLPTGLNGYNYTFTYKEKIKFMVKLDRVEVFNSGIYQVMLNYNRVMGIHMTLSGYACREFEKDFDWMWLIKYCIDKNANISRIDIAWDVFNPRYITLNRITESVRSSSLTTRAKKAMICEEVFIESGELTGQSIKFGSSSSNMMMMCYDKLKERKNASYKVDDNVNYWVRLELRLRKEVAYNFIREVNQDNFHKVASAALRGFVKFRLKNPDNNQKTRWEIAPWWKSFIEETKDIRLSNKAVQSTIQQKFKWVDMSVTKTVAQCLLSFNPDDMYGHQLQQWLYEGVSKIKNSDLKQINTFRLENGGSVITQEDLDAIKEKLVWYTW